MANSTRRDIELRINANDLSGKTLDDLLGTFDKLRESQEKFAQSGEGSKRSIRELKQDLSDLQKIAVELKSRGALADQFAGLQLQVEKASDRLQKARDALGEFNSKQEKGTELTKVQAKEFNRLTREVDRAQKSLDETSSRASKLGEELSKMGKGGADETRAALLSFSTELGNSLQTVEGSIRNYDKALRDSAQAEKASAQAKKELSESLAKLDAQDKQFFNEATQRQAELARNAAQSAAVRKSAEEQQSRTRAFQEQGQDALKAASSIEALTRDYDALTVSSRKAGDSIREILNPARQAITGIDGLEKTIGDLSNKLRDASSNAGLREEIKKLRGEYTSLANDAGRTAASLVDDIGAYKQSQQALTTLRASVEAAQQAAIKLGEKMSLAKVPNEDLAKTSSKAQGELRGLVTQFEREAQAVAVLRARLIEAGVDVNKLADAEQRLKTVAGQVVESQQRLGAVVVGVGESARKAASGLSLFEDSGRKTLSASQRLRGEILSLTASYTGLFAAVQLAQGVVESSIGREQIIRQLEIVTDSAEQAKVKFSELRKTADRLNVSFTESAKGYAKIAIAGKDAGLSTQKIDEIFENTLSVTNKLGLSADQTAHVFKAFTDILSKGTVQSEELKGQLGDVLPGAFGAMASALGVTTKELTKLLEAGGVSAQVLPAFIEKYKETTDKAANANDSLVASLARFNNAVNDLKLAIGDAGFIESFTELLKEATKAIKSGELNDAIKGIGTAFKFVAEIAKFLLENINLVLGAFATFATWKIGSLIVSLGKDLKGFASGLLTVARNAGTLVASSRLLQSVLSSLGLVLLTVSSFQAGKWIGEWLNGFAAFRESVVLLAGAFVELGGAIGDVITLDFSNLEKRLSRLKDQARITREVWRGRPDSTGGATGAWEPSTGGATGTWEDSDNVRMAQAEITKGMIEKVEKEIKKIRQRGAIETAKSIKDIEAQVRAEYVETQEIVDDLRKRDATAADQMQASLNKEIATIVAAKRKEQGDKFSRGDRGAQQEALEEAKQFAERIKDQIKTDESILEQSYQRGLVNLVDYYAKRRDLTLKGIDAEIEASKQQIAILEKDRSRDPKVGKEVEKLEGDIARLNQAKADAARNYAFEVEQGTKGLDRQRRVLQASLNELTGNDQQSQLSALQTSYDEQLLSLQKLSDAEKDRAIEILNTTTAIKAQLIGIEAVRKQSEFTSNLAGAKLANDVSQGRTTQVQQLERQSEINRQLLADTEALEQAYRQAGITGGDAYDAIRLKIEQLKGQTDLLLDEVNRTFKDAASRFMDTLIRERSAKGAAKEFGKGLGDAVAKAFSDAFSSTVADILKEAGITEMFRNLLKGITGNLFSGISGLFGKTPAPSSGGGTAFAHSGGVVGPGLPTRYVNPIAFIGAPRYHSGGLPGLRHNEVPTVLLKGEEVLSRTDPRNVMNGGRNGGTFTVKLDHRSMHMTMREWLEREMANLGSTQ